MWTVRRCLGSSPLSPSFLRNWTITWSSVRVGHDQATAPSAITPCPNNIPARCRHSSVVRLGLASPTLAPSRPNLPFLKIESNPSNRFQCEVNCSWLMRARELLADIHALVEEMLSFERKYGIRSEIFFAAYAQGEEPENEAWVLDFTEWADRKSTRLNSSHLG